MAPTVQKALTVLEAKAPWKLVNDWPVEAPGPNDVLVRLVAVAVNPADYAIQAHGLPFITYPFIGGLDGTGIVEEVGSEVTSFSKGDKVVHPGGFETKRATFKEYATVPAENIAKIPDSVTFEQAASIPVALSTVVCASSIGLTPAWEESGLTKYAGQPAFINGGASSVGQCAIQLAKLQGFSPIITVASPRHTEYLKSLGATAVVDRSLSPADIVAEVLKLANGKPVPYAFDAIGQEVTQNLAYDILAADGGLAVTMPGSERFLAEKVARDGGSKKIARPFASLQLPGNKEAGVQLYKRLAQWLQDGTLKPNKVEVIPGGLEGVVAACKRMADGQVSGVKLIVKASEASLTWQEESCTCMEEK